MTAVTGTGSSVLSNMWGNGTGVAPVEGTGNSTLSDMTSQGTGFGAVMGAGASTFPTMLGFGRGVISPPQGAPDGYFYTSLPSIFPVPFPGDAVIAGPPIITNPRVLIEHSLMDRKIRAERSDLLDGRRIYRTLPTFLERMSKDAVGYFIQIGKFKYYWSAANPVAPSDGFFHDWNPL